MQLVRQHIHGGTLERGGIKAIYVAPMKALAQEVVSKFSKRLKPLGLVRIEAERMRDGNIFNRSFLNLFVALCQRRAVVLLGPRHVGSDAWSHENGGPSPEKLFFWFALHVYIVCAFCLRRAIDFLQPSGRPRLVSMVVKPTPLPYVIHDRRG